MAELLLIYLTTSKGLAPGVLAWLLEPGPLRHYAAGKPVVLVRNPADQLLSSAM